MVALQRQITFLATLLATFQFFKIVHSNQQSKYFKG